MSRPKVLLTGTIDLPAAQEEWRKLAGSVEAVSPKASCRQAFIEECKSGALDGVLVMYRTFPSVDITGRIDEELISVLPTSLKFICHNGAGYDQIDIPQCSKRNIYVSHVPTAVDDATADAAVFLIIGCLRNFGTSMHALREHKWRGNPLPSLGHDPEGKTLGILGMGGIGRNLANKMRAFGMKIIYHNRRRLSEKEEEGARFVSFEELLKSSDVLSVNIPLNPHTRHFISTEQFNMMKKGSVVINTARGAVIDEAAMVEALDSGQISSAGLDVYEEEPKIHPSLVKNQRVLLLPHMGTWTVETQEGMEKWNIKNVRMAVTEGRLASRVPEQEGMSYK